MIKLAVKNLLQEKARLVTAVGGVAAAIVLILFLDGVFVGSSEQTVAYIERSGAGVWVMQKGASNMHMAASALPEVVTDRLRAAPGVKSATPILYAGTLLSAGGKESFSYVVGLRQDAQRGAPWAMKAGDPIPGQGEAVLPEILTRKAGLTIGDEVTILNRPFTVVGLSEGTFTLANTVTFISYDDLAAIMAAPGVASYILVEPEKGTDPSALARTLMESFPEVNALTSSQLADNDRAMIRQMGANIIQVMSFIGSIVGVLVIGLTTYTATVRRAREYGVVKALGATNAGLLTVIVLQTLVLAMLSLIVAVAVMYALIPLLGIVAPEVPIALSPGSLAMRVGTTLVIAVVAAVLPAIRMSRVEPAVVFKG